MVRPSGDQAGSKDVPAIVLPRLPSALTTATYRCSTPLAKKWSVYASSDPSGDHETAPLALSAAMCRSEPSAFITNTSVSGSPEEGSRRATKAIFFPSGDQLGYLGELKRNACCSGTVSFLLWLPSGCIE
jgi:hypothetical protein